MNLKNLILYSKNKSEEYLQYDLIYIKIRNTKLKTTIETFMINFFLKECFLSGSEHREGNWELQVTLS